MFQALRMMSGRRITSAVLVVGAGAYVMTERRADASTLRGRGFGVQPFMPLVPYASADKGSVNVPVNKSAQVVVLDASNSAAVAAAAADDAPVPTPAATPTPTALGGKSEAPSSSSSKPKFVILGIDEDVDDADIDMTPAESCGFCAYFLNSPCKKAFHKWRLCVESKKEADEEFAESCLDYTRALAVCVDANKMDFSSDAGEGEGEGESESRGEGGVKAAAAADREEAATGVAQTVVVSYGEGPAVAAIRRQ